MLWLLEELQLTYQHVELGHNVGDTETDGFGKLNPIRKVPVLVDGDRVIWESNSILRYLADEYVHEQWHAEDAYQRSLFERWMDWSQTVFEPAFVGVFWGYYRTPQSLRNEEQIEESLLACRDCLRKIEDQLDKCAYLASDHLSLADVCAGVFIYRLVEIDLNIELPENVGKWYKKLTKLKGYQRWVMSDFSSLKGRLQY